MATGDAFLKFDLAMLNLWIGLCRGAGLPRNLRELGYTDKWTTMPRHGVEIIANPLDLQPDKRTAAWRKLRSAQKDLIEGLRTGGGQLQLPLDAPNSD